MTSLTVMAKTVSGVTIYKCAFVSVSLTYGEDGCVKNNMLLLSYESLLVTFHQ